MFYEESKIIETISCSKCQEKLDEPRILPCGDTVCSSCISSIHVDNKKYECILCPEQHAMPEKGLPINKKLLILIAVQPSEVYRSEAVETLKNKLNDLNRNINSLSFGVINPIDKIKEYCIDLTNKIQLATEEAIEHLNKLNEEAINQVKTYENECIKTFEMREDIKEAFNKTIKDLKLFYSKWSEYLKQTQISDEEIKNASNEAIRLNHKAEKKILSLDCLIFSRSILNFLKNPNKPEKIGSLRMEIINDFNSNILTHEQMMELMKLCQFPNTKVWTLLYRATTDGFSACSFHSKCDNKPNTLVIIKSKSGNVFGGYTQQDWSSRFGLHKKDPSAFIFSFINSQNEPLVMKCQETKYAIYCDKNFGPTFGENKPVTVAFSNPSSAAFVFNGSTSSTSSSKPLAHSSPLFMFGGKLTSTPKAAVTNPLISTEKTSTPLVLSTNFESDIYICDNSNTKSESNSSLGNSYNHPKLLGKSKQTQEFLAGAFNFQTSEIEIYMH